MCLCLHICIIYIKYIVKHLDNDLDFRFLRELSLASTLYVHNFTFLTCISIFGVCASMYALYT